MTGQGVEYDDWRRWQADGWLPPGAGAPAGERSVPDREGDQGG